MSKTFWKKNVTFSESEYGNSPYQLNKQELRLATLSEQMRLLYVAMTRAEKQIYLIGKASKEKSQEFTDGKRSGNHLPLALRERLMSFKIGF